MMMMMIGEFFIMTANIFISTYKMERDGNTGIFRLTSMSSASPHFPSLYTIRKCDFVGRYSNPNSDHGKSAVPGAPTSVLAADTERLKTSPPAVVATC